MIVFLHLKWQSNYGQADPPATRRLRYKQLVVSSGDRCSLHGCIIRSLKTRVAFTIVVPGGKTIGLAIGSINRSMEPPLRHFCMKGLIILRNGVVKLNSCYEARHTVCCVCPLAFVKSACQSAGKSRSPSSHGGCRWRATKIYGIPRGVVNRRKPALSKSSFLDAVALSHTWSTPRIQVMASKSTQRHHPHDL
jgi:hypothetical protein